MQIHLLTYQRVGGDGHIRKQAMLPITLHGLGNLSTGQFDFVAYGES